MLDLPFVDNTYMP